MGHTWAGTHPLRSWPPRRARLLFVTRVRDHGHPRVPPLRRAAMPPLARLLFIVRRRPPSRASSPSRAQARPCAPPLHYMDLGMEERAIGGIEERGMVPDLDEGEEDGLAATPSSPWCWCYGPLRAPCWCCHFSFFFFSQRSDQNEGGSGIGLHTRCRQQTSDLHLKRHFYWDKSLRLKQHSYWDRGSTC